MKENPQKSRKLLRIFLKFIKKSKGGTNMKQIRRRALCMILAILVAAPWHPGMVRAASGNMVMTVRAADMDP